MNLLQAPSGRGLWSVPFIAGVGGFSSQQTPELHRLLALHHQLRVAVLPDHGGHLPGHVPLVAAGALAEGENGF